MELLNNRYVRLVLLTLGLGLLFWAITWVILNSVGLKDFPVMLQVAFSFLAAGLLVAKYLANRIF